ncbi:MAG TPA: hypothetical protein VE641_08330 [Chthoniobacterales bacterium]|nr:hypothetical protein [Chthoniobacterales bacterium]
MKYWLYLLAKLIVVVAIACALQLALLHYYAAHSSKPSSPLFLRDMLFTFGTLGVWLVGAGLLSLALWDQRRRCRTCLRRLIMPLKTGSWGHMVLLGRPTTEMICPFGHGTLYIEELQLVGHQYRDWHAHDGDIWKELESYHQAGSNRG